MIVELHLLQNFVPSNLNRDDTGAPKNCEFGGVPRARISSQCLKRTVRDAFDRDARLPSMRRARRTKRVREELLRQLMHGHGLAEAEADAIVRNALLAGLDLKMTAKGLTEYLVFLGDQEIAALAELCVAHREALTPGPQGKAKGLDQRGKRAFEEALAQGQSIDVALFGRMIANLPERNVEASCQVAHAISTHRVSVEFDYYTALDDLKRDDTPGADMIGTIEFNSACYYRYASVDVEQLVGNLVRRNGATPAEVEEARRVAREALAAWLRASVTAVPSGKVNSMAHHNRPSLVLTVLREASRCSLANAFVRPVRATGTNDLVRESARALDRHWGGLSQMYGDDGLAGAWLSVLEDQAERLELRHLQAPAVERVARVADVIGRTVEAVRFGAPAEVA